MANIIRQKITDVPDRIPTAEDIQLGQLAINTHDGKMFFKRDRNGDVSIVQVGLEDAADNVYYVSKNGRDINMGNTIADAWGTLEHAVANVPRGATIFLKTGDYTIQNPIVVPEDVSIIGDNLRTTIIRPANKTSDILYVSNGSYIHDLTFKDHEAPGAAIAFNPDDSAGPINASPYIQNCTSMTTTGTGLRIDGSDANGTKSMVVDAYTQYNQGGIGIHILNKGYAQLVSVFTICCDVAILCETGGFCSVTNSNSSFGNYGLKADGVSDLLYSGTLVEQQDLNQFKIKDLVKKPVIGNAISINGSNTYFTVASASELSIGETTEEDPVFANESAVKQVARATVLGAKNKIQIDTIDFINETYPEFDYNNFKCTRDLGFILDAVIDDMVFGTNYKTVTAGLAYYRATANTVIDEQLTETVAAINFAKDQAVEVILTETEKTTVGENFGIITDIISGGANTAPEIIYPDPTGALNTTSAAADTLQLNKDFLTDEAIAYIAEFYPSLSYDETLCRRDVGFIVDALTYDILYGGNSQTIVAANAYWNGGVFQLSMSEKQATIDTYGHLRSLIFNVLANAAIPSGLLYNTTTPQDTSIGVFSSDEGTKGEQLFDIIIELLSNGFTSIITTEEAARTSSEYSADATFDFYQFSLISSSSHTFEYVGSGTNINTALPNQGGVPVAENQVIQINGGQVYYTSTDEKGDFSIGEDLLIDRSTGTITGTTFDRSLFAVLTPYILALED